MNSPLFLCTYLTAEFGSQEANKSYKVKARLFLLLSVILLVLSAIDAKAGIIDDGIDYESEEVDNHILGIACIIDSKPILEPQFVWPGRIGLIQSVMIEKYGYLSWYYMFLIVLFMNIIFIIALIIFLIEICILR